MLRFWRRYWYYIGGVLFVILSFVMGLWGCFHLTPIQVMLIFSWMAMLVHQFEEYALPGGFPSMANIAIMGETQRPDGYPFNSLQCWLSNAVFCYLAYLLPVFFPNLLWMSASQIYAGLWQIPAHGIIANRRMHSFYNPGLGATIFLQLPLAIYFIWYVRTNMPGHETDLLIGIVGSVLLLGLVFGLPVLLMKNRHTNYPFEEREMFGYKADYIKTVFQKNIDAEKRKK